MTKADPQITHGREGWMIYSKAGEDIWTTTEYLDGLPDRSTGTFAGSGEERDLFSCHPAMNRTDDCCSQGCVQALTVAVVVVEIVIGM